MGRLDRPHLSANAYAKLTSWSPCRRRRPRPAGCTSSHLRYDGDKLVDGIQEAIAIGEQAHLPVHIFHLKVTGTNNFGRMKEVIALVEAAQKRGVEVSAESVSVRREQHRPDGQTLPPWAQEGGNEQPGRAAAQPRGARAAAARDGRSASDVGEPLRVGGHVAQHPDRVGGRPRGGADKELRRLARSTRRRRRPQGPVRFRLRAADRRAAAA